MSGPDAARGPKAVARFLRPRSVAIVGISTRAGSAGQIILQCLKLNRFEGEIHLVGRSAEPIDGRPVLKSDLVHHIEEIPGVDGVDSLEMRDELRDVGVEHVRVDDDELPFLINVHIAEKVRDDIK